MGEYGLFDFATEKKCTYCGKELKDMLMEKLSDKTPCPKSPDGEHHFEKDEVKKS